MTEEVMMVPVSEFKRLQDYYKGQISQSALLNKAGRLAAEKQLILGNPTIPDGMAVKMVKPLAREQTLLTKRIRTGGAPRAGVGAPAPDEEALDSPLENSLKQVIQGQTPARIKQEVSTPAGPSGIKKEPKSSRTPRRLLPETPKTVKKPASSAKPSRIPRPISSGKKPKSGGLKQSVLSGAKKGFLRGIGLDSQSIDDDLDDEEGGYSPKKVTKKYKKRKPTAAECLKPWEEWKNTSRRLGYDKN